MDQKKSVFSRGRMKKKLCPFDMQAFRTASKNSNPQEYLLGCFEEAKALAGVEVMY